MKLMTVIVAGFIVNWFSPLNYYTVNGFIVNSLMITVLWLVLYMILKVHACRSNAKRLHRLIVNTLTRLSYDNPKELENELAYVEAKLIEFRAWALPISNQRALHQEQAFQWAEGIEDAITEIRKDPEFYAMMNGAPCGTHRTN
jgi:hypothetical protein